MKETGWGQSKEAKKTCARGAWAAHRYIQPSSPGQETPLLLITEAAANEEEHVTCLWHTLDTL